MIDKAGHVAGAAEAVAVFQRHCGTSDEHAIADLICDLGHLAEERGFDFLDEVKRGIGHWYAERHVSGRNYLGPDGPRWDCVPTRKILAPRAARAGSACEISSDSASSAAGQGRRIPKVQPIGTSMSA